MNALNQERTSMNGPGGDFDASKEIQCPTSEFCVKAHMKVDGTKGIVHGCRDSVSNGVDSKGTV